MIEERPIPSCPGYAATSDGRIISLARTLPRGSKLRRRELSARTRKDGRLDLRCGRGPTKEVHRLVLEAFVGPCPEGMECCHNDGNPANNRIENLRWDLRSANAYDAVRHGTHPGLHQFRKGEANGRAKLTELDVRWIRCLYKAGVRNKDLAEGYHVANQTISYIVTRKTWKHVPEPMHV